MFGTKIRSWMEAHLARSRAKRKERSGKAESAQQQQQQYQEQRDFFDPAFLATRVDLQEQMLPSLAISSFKPQQQQQQASQASGRRPHLTQPPPPPRQQSLRSSQQQQQQPHYENGSNKVAGSAVNLSSPESAYSTGYSTDGTSPCVTYAPEYYINVRQQQQQHQQQQKKKKKQDATLRTEQAAAGTESYIKQNPSTTQTRSRPNQRIVEERRTQSTKDPRLSEKLRPPPPPPPPPSSSSSSSTRTHRNGQIDGTGTYTVSRARYEQQQQQQHSWRKPEAPISSRGPVAAEHSPRIHSPSYHIARNNRPYASSPLTGGSGSPVPPNYPLQLFSPRKLPLLVTTTTQVMPVKSPRQPSRLITSPWQSRNAVAATGAMVVAPRAWDKQSYDYCCRQESLSVGRSPVNRCDWRAAGLLQTSGCQQKQKQQQPVRSRTRRGSSSASSCSSRGQSCSVSSSSNSLSNASSCSGSSDDATLNEVMGKFKEGYAYEKETDIVSDQSGADENRSLSLNFSSEEASAGGSFELLEQVEHGGSSRSTSRSRRQPRGRRRRKHRRPFNYSHDDDEDEDTEQREELEVLQEILNRRLKKSKGEVSAQTNRALLERLLMKSGDFEGRRAWSVYPSGPLPMRSAASRSLGGTPICLRRRTQPRHLQSPLSRFAFHRHPPVYQVESASLLKNTSASELALIEADKEADLKYAQLIMEAERMLNNAQEELEREESVTSSHRGSAASIFGPDCCSPTRIPHANRLYTQPVAQSQLQQQQQQACTTYGLAPNKRVELLKNAELNIELALSKSRNSQPELSSGSIKDLLDHSSPKRLLQQQQQQQCKKIMEPIVIQTTFTSSTVVPPNNVTASKSLDVNRPTVIPRNLITTKATSTATSALDDLSLTSEHYCCPQSEPVKRKVYELAHPESRLQLLQQQQPAPWLRNSDTDFTHTEQQPQLQSSTSAASSYSQLRKHMLIETLQGLKQSLEDQSAALKMSCLRPL